MIDDEMIDAIGRPLLIIAVMLATLAIIYCCSGPGWSAEINTTELDDAMTRCRQHVVPDPKLGQYVFAPGWEQCNAINAMWQAMRGAGPASSETDKAIVGEVLRKRLQ